MSEVIAYCAGFFDGEGCISLERVGAEHRLRCITSQKFDRRPLDIMAAEFGGKVHLFGDGIHRHIVNGRRAVTMLERMAPWLTVKAAQAEIAVRMFELDRDERDVALAELRRLKRTHAERTGT